jgi:hypothetical protein
MELRGAASRSQAGCGSHGRFFSMPTGNLLVCFYGFVLPTLLDLPEPRSLCSGFRAALRLQYG